MTIRILKGISGRERWFRAPVVAMQHIFAQFVGIPLTYWANFVNAAAGKPMKRMPRFQAFLPAKRALPRWRNWARPAVYRAT